MLPAMAWVILVIAGLFEVSWAVGLKFTEGFTRLSASIATVLSLIASMALLGVAVRTLPIGTAYAVWKGIGTVGTALAGIVLLKESMSPLQLLCIALVVAGSAGLKVLSA